MFKCCGSWSCANQHHARNSFICFIDGLHSNESLGCSSVFRKWRKLYCWCSSCPSSKYSIHVFQYCVFSELSDLLEKRLNHQNPIWLLYQDRIVLVRVFQFSCLLFPFFIVLRNQFFFMESILLIKPRSVFNSGFGFLRFLLEPSLNHVVFPQVS